MTPVEIEPSPPVMVIVAAPVAVLGGTSKLICADET
jgi:hypothetical protein